LTQEGLAKVFEEAVKVILFPNKEEEPAASSEKKSSKKKSGKEDKKDCIIQ